MRKQIIFITSYFSALIFLLSIGGCVKYTTTYFPKSMETTPVNKLVKVIIPNTEKIVAIDDETVISTPVMYVSPGKHTYTFKIDYKSGTYCNGPSYGLKAERDVIVDEGKVSSVVFMDGKYEMDASASEGQTVEFIFKPEPDCKSKIREYFRVEIHDN